MNSAHLNLITELRHDLHAHPELSMHEAETKARLLHFITDNTELEVVDRGLWFYAVYHGTPTSPRTDSSIDSKPDPDSDPKPGPVSAVSGSSFSADSDPTSGPVSSAAGSPFSSASGTYLPPIAFRAEFDALPVDEAAELPWHSRTPGVSHKCGHDGHAAVLAGLALEIDRSGAGRDVYFIFQHAEETGQGGEPCSQLIREKGIREVYACHNMSGIPRGTIALREGSMWCASEGLTLSFEGRPSHASHPEEGINPADCISEMILFLRNFQASSVFTGMVLATVVGVRVGEGDFGVSPGSGSLSVTLRGEIESEIQILRTGICRRAEQLAKRDGLRLSILESDVFLETVNDPECTERVREAALALGIPVQTMAEPMRSSEDFGWFTHACPGACFLIGNGEKYPAIHTPQFDYIDELMPKVVDLFARIAAAHTEKI